MAQPQASTTTQVELPAANVNAGPFDSNPTATTLQGSSSDPPKPPISQSHQASQLPSYDNHPRRSLAQSSVTEPNFSIYDDISPPAYHEYPDATAIYDNQGLSAPPQYGTRPDSTDAIAIWLARKILVRMKRVHRLWYLVLILLLG